MRIGMVCPYSFSVPGGVQAHVAELAAVFIDRGHHVSVIAPADGDTDLPDYVVSGGPALAIPYNGSVSRVNFSPNGYRRLRRWIADNHFDVLHVHEPNSPSLSMMALMVASGPIVTTFHTSTSKSLWLSTFQGMLRPYHERISGKIAVSELARRWQMESLGSDAVEIPNGINVGSFADAEPLDGYPWPGRTVLFLGRYDEPRKGIDILMRALPTVVERFGDLRVLVVGGGNQKALRRRAGDLADHLVFLGQVDDATKARALASADVYCAPNLGGESFGIVLVEAMAAGAAVIASKLDAFRRVLDDGRAGRLFAVGAADELASGLIELLADDEARADLVRAARARAARYDWSRVADQIMRVYETVTVGAGPVVVSD
ncbi:GDP-mannose-dependent alpha-(1-2)-phosphatidylinositol mannosyltransferase PimA [Gordonia polyisoprenivorans VH2]|uniref:GDP-mannose-dependent alpha-(1-2)-phosphatidylinositol mannosyltransferase PimA n=2 Tax=Gordonia polyisoprenivorans TaxID=84595 RepID=H6MZX6_GORPV|nr:glycosyltransferase family 4 protein [Gordonia polyisoprenivorans]AFA73227.1 GDP-mannose-dependent alpha-(1-2)-phosphatidylinositol mannosyltransferase PimA [Gordonia polyisoprenivorans VH2]MBE7194023.1 glycosyltransferase family 4 protein [Gordonia polyisoprenivorans]NKY02194.1 glycosyltransferase family 4 protein [Gordonia polyisoprenivorans]OZC30344.1 glycosyltransferase family 1 protein [Gordonia polyisoprenivorans]QUD85264.1 glycosyltransferase family 4 protein [Gordonia polyisoprenivo